jgi:hypothetical protein
MGTTGAATNLPRLARQAGGLLWGIMSEFESERRAALQRRDVAS